MLTDTMNTALNNNYTFGSHFLPAAKQQIILDDTAAILFDIYTNDNSKNSGYEKPLIEALLREVLSIAKIQIKLPKQIPHGIAPYSIIVEQSKQLKAILQSSAYNYQVGESDAVIIFCVQQKFNIEIVHEYINEMQTDFKNFDADLFKKILLSYTDDLSNIKKQLWCEQLACAAFYTALQAAPKFNADAFPISKFDTQKFDEVLNLSAKGLKSLFALVVCSKY